MGTRSSRTLRGSMDLFDRQYRFIAGKPSAMGFEVGGGDSCRPLHVSFDVQRADLESPNTAKVTLWNLSPAHVAAVEEDDCVVALRAGYGRHMAHVFAGNVTYSRTSLDGADRMTEIEATDGRVALRDTYLSISYTDGINTRRIIEDIAAQMGVALSVSYNAAFAEAPDGYAYIGLAGGALDKACAMSGLSWHIHSGVLQVKAAGGTMTREVYLLNAASGLVGIPRRVVIAKDNKTGSEQKGVEIDYLMNAAINVDDYIKLESKLASGYYRVHSIDISGDNYDGPWMCTARLLEAA